MDSIHSKLPSNLLDTHSELLHQLTQEVKQMYYNSMKRVTGEFITLTVIKLTRCEYFLSTVQQTLLKPPVNGLSPDDPLPVEPTGLDHSTPWRDSYESNREALKKALLIVHPLHQELLCLWRKHGLHSILSLEKLR